jgi:membrane protease YdiL (CAAX protease family)
MLPYIRTVFGAIEVGCPATVAVMETRHRWSLVVPVVGLVAAVVLLPLATSEGVPAGMRDVVPYLVTWVPLLVAVVVSVLLARRRRPDRWWVALRLPVGATGVVLALFVGLAARTVGVLVEAVATGRIGGGSLFSGVGPSPAAGVAFVLLSTVLVAPALEEVFFRGTLLPAVEERMGWGRVAEWAAIILVAAIFAGVHALAGAGVVGAVVTFVAGVGFGALARSQGVGSAVIAHSVFNASGVALTLSSTGLSPLSPTLGLG